MIGVIANPADDAVVSEFFQLFKTPWEFYRNDRQYDAVLCTTNTMCDGAVAKLILMYSGHEHPYDTEEKMEIAAHRNNATLLYNGTRIPIYGSSVSFRQQGTVALVDEEGQQVAIHRRQSGGRVTMRIGYDLFSEIRSLLTTGQPVVHAGTPTLELHIAVLRDLIVSNGIRLVEIPPVPDGYKFIACLTHDVDHPSIRSHGFDHTTIGFLYRATIGSLGDFLRGRIRLRTVLMTWAAAIKLPFVHIGLAKDFWLDFDDRYLELEKGLRSTFFVIPFEDNPGSNSQGLAPKFRAARYGARDIADSIQKVAAAGCEVGLHGIDAWLDSSRGHEELEEIRRVTGASDIGVRMHWLYFDQQSPVALEEAGADYDSTIGYNETAGYRAGTAQAYKPLQAARLLELPLHVMDTALFYPSHLGLSQGQATTALNQLVDNAVRFGGCLTINWHDRSLAPERLWDDCYRAFIQELKSRGAWFATTGQGTSWFRKRRSVVFETDRGEPGALARVLAEHCDNVPGLRLRVHEGRDSRNGAQASEGYVDAAFEKSIDACWKRGAPVATPVQFPASLGAH